MVGGLPGRNYARGWRGATFEGIYREAPGGGSPVLLNVFLNRTGPLAPPQHDPHYRVPSPGPEAWGPGGSGGGREAPPVFSLWLWAPVECLL